MNISRDNLHPTDTIIAIMGPTGAGKSNFIDVLAGQPGARTGHQLASYTAEVQAIVLDGYDGDQRVILVDTPGFDDTHRSDMEILDMIGKWLENTYRDKIQLAGILYMHRISDNRMGGSPLKNVRMFGELCGSSAMSRVILVTTMWDRISHEAGEMRERELQDKFWNKMLDYGSHCARFSNTAESAKSIVDELITAKMKRETLLLQEELVDLKKRLNETHAGRMLYNTLQKLLDEQKEAVAKLITQLEGQPGGQNSQLAKELRKERDRIERLLEQTLEDVRQLKVPLSRRIALFFSGKKGKIKTIS